MKARELLISNVGEHAMVVTYDEEISRNVRPNPEGRVFSASGDELVSDTFGHTLAYWQNKTLVLETDPPHGGQIVEKFALNGEQQLTYSIRLNMRVLKERSELRLVFDRKGK